MFFGKWAVMFVLLVVAVPSGCLPVMTVGSALEARRVYHSKSRFTDESARRTAVGVTAVFGLMSAAWLLVYGYLWRRSFVDPDREVMGLRKGVWRVLLVAAQALGLAAGLVVLFDLAK